MFQFKKGDILIQESAVIGFLTDLDTKLCSAVFHYIYLYDHRRQE